MVGPYYNQDARKRIDATVLRVESTPDSIDGDQVFDRPAPSERPAPYVNDSGETIPAFGCMVIDDGDFYDVANGVPYFSATKPTSTLVDRYAINGARDIASGDHGQCYLYGQVRALYNTGTPAAGDAFGPTPGQWYLTQDYPVMFRAEVISSASDKIMFGVLEMISPLRFQLTAELSPGGTANSYPMDDTGATKAAFTVPVTDMLGDRFGWGPGTFAAFSFGAEGTAEYMPDGKRWEVQSIQEIAEQISFTTTEHMGTSVSNEAECTVDSFGRGLDPDTYFDPVIVSDPQQLFSHAQSGAKGKATYNKEAQEYHITDCETMAETILVQASAATSGSTISVDSVVVYNPETGQDPSAGPATRDPTNIGVHNTFADSIVDDQFFEAVWNKTDDVWEVSEIVRPSLMYAKAATDWAVNGGDPKVSVQACDDRDGTGAADPKFDVYFQVNNLQDPAVYPDQIITYEFGTDGVPMCTSPGAFDGRIGDIMFLADADDIRKGWREYDEAAGRALIQRAPNGSVVNEKVAGVDVGQLLHGDTSNSHPDHSNHEHRISPGSGTKRYSDVTGGTTGDRFYDADEDLDTGGSVVTAVGGVSWPTSHDGFFDENLDSGDTDTDNRGPRRVVIMAIRVVGVGDG